MPESQPTIGSMIGERALSALLEASAAINASLDLEPVLRQIAKSAAHVLEAEASSVLLVDRARNKLIFKAAVGVQSASLIGQEFDANLGIAGRVAGRNKAELVTDAHDDPAFFPEFDAKSSFVTRGVIAAPLRFRGSVIGVVEVLNKRDGQDFAPSDVEVLQIFANLAAISVCNAHAHEVIKKENLSLRQAVGSDDAIIGESKPLAEVLKLCDRVASTNANVLLLGETGTGKEVSARRIHSASNRAGKAFIAINCAALPETLLESELFGHEAGAFTGADKARMGRFELADGGTLFLDEIGDITASTQVKLLRVLQEREFVRVGGSKTISCDARIIAATNRDLKKAMEDGEFREDLFYRLNVFPISLPPLRERRDDIPLLVRHFCERTASELGWLKPRISDEAMERLRVYRWPGNIREMRNVVERMVLLCDTGEITPSLLPPEFASGAEEAAAEEEQQVSALEGYEKAMIVQALEENDWNQTQAAKALDISRDNLRYRLRKYDIRRPGEEDGD